MTCERSDWRPGALRYKSQDGLWVVTEPHDAMYSTATMVATEWWDVTSQAWRPILEDDAATAPA